MRYGDHGMDFYGNAILAGQSMIAERPDVLRRFVAASARGWRETLANPAAGAAIIKKEVGLARAPTEAEIWDGRFLPPAAERRARSGIATWAKRRCGCAR